jgi:hypothetical protein
VKGGEVELHTFLILALDTGSGQTDSPDAICLGKTPQYTLGMRVGLHTVTTTKTTYAARYMHLVA